MTEYWLYNHQNQQLNTCKSIAMREKWDNMKKASLLHKKNLKTDENKLNKAQTELTHTKKNN